MTDIMWDIVNVQNFQIHQFRNFLASHTNYTSATDHTGAPLTVKMTASPND